MGALDQLVDTLGEEGSKALATAIGSIDADEAWQQLAIGIAADFVKQNGAAGVDMAWEALDKAMSGETPDLSGMSLRASSDLLAKLQSDEFTNKNEVRNWFVKLGDTMGPILAALLTSAIKSA